MLARGEHLSALSARGIEIVGGPDACLVRVTTAAMPTAAEPANLVLFTVKTYDTEATCESLQSSLAPDALILELQNGVDRANQYGRFLGSSSVLSGAVYMESTIESPGVVRYLSGARRIVFGEPDGGITPRVAALREVLVGAGINAEASADMTTELWRKFILVCAANALTALTRMPFGEIVGSAAGRQLVEDIISEAVTVGHRGGARIDGDTVEQSRAFLSYGPRLRSSMLRDIERGGSSRWTR